MANQAPASDRSVGGDDNEPTAAQIVASVIDSIDPEREQIILANEWTKETAVVNEDTLPQVEACIKKLTEISGKVSARKKEHVDPIYANYIEHRDAWNDATNFIKKIITTLKTRRADHKAEVRKAAEAAEAEAQRKRDEAAAEAAKADAKAKEEQAATGKVSEETAEAAEAAKSEAKAASKAVTAAKETSKEAREGTKKVEVAFIPDGKRGVVLDWMKSNEEARADLGAFLDEWVKKNAKDYRKREITIPGVEFKHEIAPR